MTNEQVAFNLTEKCDIYFEGSLISKERIVKRYADFFTDSFSGKEHSVSVALHTGSICFDIISLLTTALACLFIDDSNNNNIIEQLDIGNFVLYGREKQERYVWCGFADKNRKPILAYDEASDKPHYAVLEQPTKATRDKSYVPRKLWHLITPYNGDSQTTDGRGLGKRDADRNNFISYMFGIPSAEVPSITGVSTVIVAERSTFERISKGLRIVYDKSKSIGLLDIVTASYYTDSGEGLPYGGNPGKNDPVLKITGKVSTARDLVLDRRGNRAVGLMIIGSVNMTKDSSELTDLFERKSLKFVHLSDNTDSDSTESIIGIHEDAAIFACTKEFLLHNSLPPQEKNFFTEELDRQIENIINNSVSVVFVDGGCLWEDLRKAKEALCTIRQSDWNDESKSNFIITAYSLINLFTTAVFPINDLEQAIADGKFNMGISSPSAKISELWNLADSAGTVDEQCIYVMDLIERLYNANLYECSKHSALKHQLSISKGHKIAVVVPKGYYINILSANESFKCLNAIFVTSNRFNNSERYDKIIVVGDFRGKRFDPLKCRAASDIIVLLYECEMHWFKHKKLMAGNFERKLNSKLGIVEDGLFDYDEKPTDSNADYKDMDRFTEKSIDLEQYIDSISSFNISKFMVRASGSSGFAPTSEVYSVGRFVSGEQILFSKYYNAVVFDATKGTVTETDVEGLAAGDILVFAKRDDYTRNMVDYIYETLQTFGHFSAEVSDATEKALYWKEVLREYKQASGFSYRDLAIELQKLGSSLQEVSIRQWLIEESHIVGPREEKTLEQIAELTQDSYLLSDTHDYFEACRIVRRQRKEILELIGKAITDKLSGNEPPKGSMLEIVYDNVENLSETLELESVYLLNEPVNVPINMINKPITEWEAGI